MGKYLIAYFATGLPFAAMDATWLTVMGPRLYKADLAGLFTDTPSLLPAVLFYVIYFFGVVYFCVAPALKAGRWLPVLTNGPVLALSAYATYDLTNQATLRIWSTRVTVVDLMWGVFVTTTAASVGFFITRWTSKR
jgi:uncharacterized membrane protein